LLKQAENEIENRTNSLAVYFDLSGLSAEHFMPTIIKRLIDVTYTGRKKAKSLSRIRELLKSGSYDALADLGIDVDLVGILKLKLNPKQSDHWQHFSTAVTRAVKHVRDTAGYSSIVLILDEVNAIAEWEEFRDILVKLRSFAQETDGLNLLVGSPHSLYELTKNEWSPFYNIFYQLRIGPLADSEADELIRVPASGIGLVITPDAITRIKQLSGNKPYYIQVLGTKICERLMKEKTVLNSVDLEEVDLAVDGTIEQLDTHFSRLWERCTEYQRNVVMALCSGQDAEFKRLMGDLQYRTEFSLLRDRDLIWRQGNSYSFAGLLGEWLRNW
jgi:hypothetical protein